MAGKNGRVSEGWEFLGENLWEYQKKYGNNRRENYGRKEREGIRRMGIIGGKTIWPERVGEYHKDGN
jgi:hypothetical protein